MTLLGSVMYPVIAEAATVAGDAMKISASVLPIRPVKFRVLDVMHISRVRRERHTGEPLMVTEAWLPADLADDIDQDELRRTPLYTLLSAAGVTVDRMQHEFTAEIAGPRYAQLLATSIGAALLRVNRVAFAGGTAHHLLSILLLPNRSRIIVSQSAEELESGDGFAIAHDVRRRDASSGW